MSFKRRGNATHVVSLCKSEDVVVFNTVMMDAAAIIDMVAARNKPLRDAANATRLFSYDGTRGGGSPSSVLSSSMLDNCTVKFVEANELKNDDGQPLVVNVSRLRKTFLNRMWMLSGQDPIMTAAMGGHGVKVSNDHYLEAPPEAEKNFSLLGEIRVKELLGTAATLPTENTPVAQCRDSKYGHRAPKNGEHCTSFLSCFRCKSFVVTEEDLYRLFSLYWLLVKERDAMGAKRWGRFYAHIVRIIDNDIGPKYGAAVIYAVRQNAHDNPHPYWRDPELLESETV